MHILAPLFSHAQNYIPVVVAPSETQVDAQSIEEARRDLLHQSEEIRLGINSTPKSTVRTLARKALLLANSRAGMFEIVHTLNETHANILAGKQKGRSARHIAQLSLNVLQTAYATDTPDPYTRQLNQQEITVRREAIARTTPTTPFQVALEEAWTAQGQPLDSLIRGNDATILEVRRENRREWRTERAAEDTIGGAQFDPFADDEDSLPAGPLL